jgi:hypothetical protein
LASLVVLAGCGPAVKVSAPKENRTASRTSTPAVATSTTTTAPELIPTHTSSASTSAADIPVAVERSPVGFYRATFSAPIEAALSDTLALKVLSNGSFRFAKGEAGTWTERNDVLTMTASSFVFVVPQAGDNLGSAGDPGTLSADGTTLGTWYAIRR